MILSRSESQSLCYVVTSSRSTTLRDKIKVFFIDCFRVISSDKKTLKHYILHIFLIFLMQNACKIKLFAYICMGIFCDRILFYNQKH